VEVLSNFADARLCVDPESTVQAPVITYHSDEQLVTFLPLGHSEAKSVAQVRLDEETWILSSVRELGEDWELRSVLDHITA
jgi:hypothetical protein